MKTSSKTILLAILMALIAWVADAVIAWRLYPDASLTTLLIEQDHTRTFYMRVVVVALFFLFGLITGNLLDRVEALNAAEQRRNRMLKGILRVHEAIVRIEDEEELIAKAREEIKRAFGLDSVHLHILPEEVDPTLATETLREEMTAAGCARYYEEFQQKLHTEGMPSGEICARDTGGGRCTCGVLSFQGKVYGLFHARAARGDDGCEAFLESLNSLLPDLGHALARLRGKARRMEQARKLEELCENAPVGIFTSTTDGKLKFLNPAMARMLDAESPALVVEECENVRQFYKNPEQRDAFLHRLQDRGKVSDFELDLVGFKGRVIHTRFAARLTGRAGGGACEIEGFCLDETKKVESEEQAERLRERLAKTRHLESIASLASGISHEFNNILQAMMGSAYLVQMGMDENQPQWRYLRDIQDSGARAARLCDQMLTYAGKKNVALRVEPADDLVESFRSQLRADLPAEAVFRMDLAAPDARVRVDPASLLEILINLVENANEAVSEGPAEISVETRELVPTPSLTRRFGMVKELADEPHWALYVRDNGEGMDEKTLDRVFDPFFSTKFQGRGLGLAAVTGILDKFDGDIGATSLPGRGTEFLVLLPLADSVLVEESKEAGEPEAQGVDVTGRVLVVDDEPMIRDTVIRFLDRWGFQSESFADGREVVDWLEAHTSEAPACMLLDVTMPRMGGLDTITHLEKTRPDLPVILMSGFDEEDTREQFKGHNLAGFIHKPFSADRLKAVLGKVVRSE